MLYALSKITAYCLFVAFLFMSMTTIARAHVFIVEQSPAENSVWDTSPSEISIQFSSKVDKSFSIKLLDQEQQEFAVKNPAISEDRKTITSQIPQLPNGQYKVKYYVISSNDGHAIEGSHRFRVEWKTPPPVQKEYVKEDSAGTVKNTPIPDQNKEPNDKLDVQQSFFNTFNYAAKMVYYFGLLVVAGWVMIWQVAKTYSVELRSKYLFFGMIFQILHLVGLMIFLLVQMNVFTSNGISFQFDFPLDTNFGKLWIASLIISLIGFVFLFKHPVFDLTWLVAILIAKSMNGHTQEFEPSWLLVVLNSFHLAAAAFWAAGILFMILFWRKQQLYVKAFLPNFSKGALFCMIVLIVSGMVLTYLYLPNGNIVLTYWGMVLLIKGIVVFGVLLLGAFIRRKIKLARTADLKRLILFDFLLFIVLILLVSILTSINPLP